MTLSADSYSFNNPYAGDWNSSELNVQANEDDSYVTTLDTDQWDISIAIVAKRKPAVIEVGSVWRSNSPYPPDARVLGLLEDDGQTYVAFIDAGYDAILLKEADFRIEYNAGPA